MPEYAIMQYKDRTKRDREGEGVSVSVKMRVFYTFVSLQETPNIGVFAVQNEKVPWNRKEKIEYFHLNSKQVNG